MHDKLMKMLGKKRDLPATEKHAKMDVVKDLRDAAAEAMGHKLGSLHKATVMSDSQEGLEKGLDKAKEVVSSGEMEDMKDHAENPYGDIKSATEEHAHDEDNEEHGWKDNPREYHEGGAVEDDEDEDSESPEEEASEGDGMDEFHGLDMHEIEEKLERLMELKRKMESHKS